jgi:hypothetical protein
MELFIMYTCTIKLFKETENGGSKTMYLKNVAYEQAEHIEKCAFVIYPTAHTITFIDDEFGFENTLYNLECCRQYRVSCNGVEKRYIDEKEALNEYENLKRFFRDSDVLVEYKCMVNGKCYCERSNQ